MVLIFWQGMGDEFRWREHVWRIGFQQNPVGRELAEDFDQGGFARMEEVAGEGKIRSEWDQAAGGFDGTTEGVHEKSRGRGSLGEDIEQRAPSLEAVDGNWAAELVGEAELIEENGALDVQGWFGNPSVQPALADGGLWVVF